MKLQFKRAYKLLVRLVTWYSGDWTVVSSVEVNVISVEVVPGFHTSFQTYHLLGFTLIGDGSLGRTWFLKYNML